MAGTSREQNLITLNLGREISSQLKERPCEAYVSDMRVLIDRTGLYTYPKEYVLISRDRVLVERFTRQGGEWLLTEWNDLSDTLQLASIGRAVPLPEIYAKVGLNPDMATG